MFERFWHRLWYAHAAAYHDMGAIMVCCNRISFLARYAVVSVHPNDGLSPIVFRCNKAKELELFSEAQSATQMRNIANVLKAESLVKK